LMHITIGVWHCTLGNSECTTDVRSIR